MKDKIIIKGNKHAVDRFLYALCPFPGGPLIFEDAPTISYNDLYKDRFIGFFHGTEIYVEYDETNIDK